MTNNIMYRTLEISLKDNNGNVIHSVPFKAGYTKEAVEDMLLHHNIDITEEVTRALFQELTHKNADDDTTPLQEALKELIRAGAEHSKK